LYAVAGIVSIPTKDKDGLVSIQDKQSSSRFRKKIAFKFLSCGIRYQI